MSAQHDPFAHLVHIRTSQKLYLSLGSSALLTKKAVHLQRAKTLEMSLRKQQSEVREILQSHAAMEENARGRVEELEVAMNELHRTAADKTRLESEQRKISNALDQFQKQINAARNEYERVSEPWRKALEQDGALQKQADAEAQKIQQISEIGSNCLDIERDLGAFLKPSEWKVLKADGGYDYTFVLLRACAYPAQDGGHVFSGA